MPKNNKLTGRQLDVMKIIWDSADSLSASQIVSKNSSLNINTVQSVLKKLLEKSFISVSDIVYSGTVLTRTYKPEVPIEAYIVDNFADVTSSIGTVPLVARLLEQDIDKKTIDELEELLNKKRCELEKG